MEDLAGGETDEINSLRDLTILSLGRRVQHSNVNFALARLRHCMRPLPSGGGAAHSTRINLENL